MVLRNYPGNLIKILSSDSILKIFHLFTNRISEKLGSLKLEMIGTILTFHQTSLKEHEYDSF